MKWTDSLPQCITYLKPVEKTSLLAMDMENMMAASAGCGFEVLVIIC
jgi:hypothetical protein